MILWFDMLLSKGDFYYEFTGTSSNDKSLQTSAG